MKNAGRYANSGLVQLFGCMKDTFYRFMNNGRTLGSIQLEAGKNSDINPEFTKKQKTARYTQPRNKDERVNVRKGGTSQ